MCDAGSFGGRGQAGIATLINSFPAHARLHQTGSRGVETAAATSIHVDVPRHGLARRPAPMMARALSHYMSERAIRPYPSKLRRR
jgi:hypothetical protein